MSFVNQHDLVPVTRISTVRKVSKYGVFSGPYFPVLSPNTGRYRPEKTPYFDTFYAVKTYALTEL